MTPWDPTPDEAATLLGWTFAPDRWHPLRHALYGLADRLGSAQRAVLRLADDLDQRHYERAARWYEEHGNGLFVPDRESEVAS